MRLRPISWFLLLGGCYSGQGIAVLVGGGEADVRTITRRFNEPWGTSPPPPTRLLGTVGYTEEEHIPFFDLSDELTAEPYYPPRSVLLMYNFAGSYFDGVPVEYIAFEVYGERIVTANCLEYWKEGALEVNVTVTGRRKDLAIVADFWMDGNALPDHTPIECWNQFQLDMTFRSVGEMSWDLRQDEYGEY